MHTDASGLAIVAILCQKDDSGAEYVVQYASRTLRGAEIHYGITEKECLAVKWGIAHFRVYLHGRKFQLKTDHKALKWLMSIKEPSGRLARWILFLQSFEFTIEYREDKKHANADALSRYAFNLEVMPRVVQDDFEISCKYLEPYEDAILLEFLRTQRLPSGASRKQCNRLERARDRFDLEDGYVWYTPDPNEHKSLKIPETDERPQIVMDAHKFGHFGAKETYLRVRERYYWKRMFDNIEVIVKRCQTCLRFNSPIEFSHPALAFPVRGVFDRVCMDIVVGFPVTKEGFKGMLVIIIYRQNKLINNNL